MASSRTPSWDTFDVVKGVLAYYPEDHIPCDVPTLHEAVFNLAKEPKFEAFFHRYHFDKRSHFPFSHDLQTDLMNLEQAGHLSSPNPELRQYERTPKLKATFSKYNRKTFTKVEIRTLHAISKNLHRQVQKASVSA